MRCGVPSALYSTVTWLLASGRSELQLAAACAARRGSRRGGGPGRSAAASASCVSSQAKPNIMPWSPAPPTSTPMAMSRRLRVELADRPGRCRRRSRSSGRRSRSRGWRRGRCVSTVGAAEVGLGGDFAGDDGEVGGDERFAGDPADRVGCEAVVEDGVADLVGHLVGVAHRDGFAGEQVTIRAHDKQSFSEGKNVPNTVTADYRESVECRKGKIQKEPAEGCSSGTVWGGRGLLRRGQPE